MRKQDGEVQQGRGVPYKVPIFRPQGMEREVRDKVFVKVKGFRASATPVEAPVGAVGRGGEDDDDDE